MSLKLTELYHEMGLIRSLLSFGSTRQPLRLSSGQALRVSLRDPRRARRVGTRRLARQALAGDGRNARAG
jgi:hypothetical protein